MVELTEAVFFKDCADSAKLPWCYWHIGTHTPQPHSFKWQKMMISFFCWTTEGNSVGLQKEVLLDYRRKFCWITEGFSWGFLRTNTMPRWTRRQTSVSSHQPKHQSLYHASNWRCEQQACLSIWNCHMTCWKMTAQNVHRAKQTTQ